jgi:hypothetical protein
LLQFKRLVQQNLSLAAAAFGMIAQALGGDAVEAVAVGAGDEERVGHGRAPRIEYSMKMIWRSEGDLSSRGQWG